MKPYLTAAILAFFFSIALGQTVVVDSLRRTEDTLGNVFYQRFLRTEVLTPKQDSAAYVDSLFTVAHNRYLPLSQAKITVINSGQYNQSFKQANQDLQNVGTSYWDIADKLFAPNFIGLWRVTQIGGQENDFYEARILNNRLIFREVDVTFSRDSTGQRRYSSVFSAGSSNARAFIRNATDFRINLYGATLDISLVAETPNDDGIGLSRLIFVDTSVSRRFAFLRDVRKEE